MISNTKGNSINETKKRTIKIPSNVSKKIKEKEELALRRSIKRTITGPRNLLVKPTKKVQKKLPVARRGFVKGASPIILSAKVNEPKKRTLRLNLNKYTQKKVVQESKPVTINQNSAFFYEPSVFEQFHLNITNVDDLNEIPVEETEEVKAVTPIPEQIENNIEESEEANEIAEADEEINTIPEDDDNIDMELLKKFDDSEMIAGLLNLNQDINVEENTESAKEDLSNSNVYEYFTDEGVEENLEAADSFNDNIIGKFIENASSKDTITSEPTFDKVKKNIFSAIPNVFKKISYDDANYVNNDQDSFDNGIVNNIQTENVAPTSVPVIENASIPDDINSISVDARKKSPVDVPQVDETLLVNKDAEGNSEVDLSTSMLSLIDTSLDENEVVNKVLKEEKKANKTKKDKSKEEKIESVDKTIKNPINVDVNLDEEINSDEEEISKVDNDTFIAEEDNGFSIEDYFGINNPDFVEEYNAQEQEKAAEEAALAEATNEGVQEEPVEENVDVEAFEKSFIDEYAKKYGDELLDDVNLEDLPIDEEEIFEEDTSDETIDDVQEELKESSGENAIKYSNAKAITKFNNDIKEFNKSVLKLNKRIITIEEKSNTELPSERTNITALKTVTLTEYKDIVSHELSSKEDAMIENLLTSALLNNNQIDDEMKGELYDEVLTDADKENIQNDDTKVSNSEDTNAQDFFKVIDSLSKAITELEKDSTTVKMLTEEEAKVAEPEVKAEEEVVDARNTDKKAFDPNSPDNTSKTIEVTAIKNVPEPEKAFNILIDQDDIFSISILNEKYEIVADYNGISVLSDNVHISTPKNNFFLNVGDKYIEIHNHQTYFIVQTDIEDVEFANAINNVTFTKKENVIELNVKEAFKLSSNENKVELSMLNTNVANINNIKPNDSKAYQNSDSALDNNTLLISEETQKVYLPYKIEEVVNKLKAENSEYTSIEEVIENEYTVPLSEFKMPIISRFKEAYKFMRTKENSSVGAAVDLALELMFNTNLNPAVIRAAKDLKELNVYLDCLYENELDKFDCFKIVYKVLPKVQ